MAKDIRAAVKAAGNLQVEEPTKPVEEAVKVPVEVAKEEPPVIEPGPRKFQIELPFLPAHTVEARDRHEAIEKYKLWTGVISSEHPFKVSEVTE